MREPSSAGMQGTVQGVNEMTNRFLSSHARIIAVGCGCISAVIYLIMINLTLAHIEAVSGYIPFDLRPLGYGSADVAELLEALGTDGRAYYLAYQIPLDTLYPAMLALTLIATLLWMGQGSPKSVIVRVGILLSIGIALFDYIENFGVLAMILTWPDVSDGLVYAASAATIAKSVFTTLAVSSVFLSGIIRMRSLRALTTRPKVGVWGQFDRMLDR